MAHKESLKTKAQEAVKKFKEKQQANKDLTKKSADALQKHIQTKNVKRLMTTEGAYKKRAPVKVSDTKSSGPKLGPAGSGGYKMYRSGGAVLKGKKVGIQIK